jgi:two-component system osmolarity sensor histidine kinase EnvZ
MQRALLNLIDNAWKYGATAVSLTATLHLDHVSLSVRDNGPGIPDAEMDRLKRPFTRLENARSNATGTGLGMAIVERVALQHGGKFELSNNPEGGLLARLVLPLKP